MMKDYKYLVERKEPRMVPESIANSWAILGVSGWMLCLYLLDKFC